MSVYVYLCEYIGHYFEDLPFLNGLICYHPSGVLDCLVSDHVIKITSWLHGPKTVLLAPRWVEALIDTWVSMSNRRHRGIDPDAMLVDSSTVATCDVGMALIGRRPL